ncbi:MAG: hypothetical protein FJX52_02160 [Alphaproteobacteria bacterium]|nr:hypothetical protein [Alphaproteobacteria bacterium]
MGAGIRGLWYRSPLYRLVIAGKAPTDLAEAPPDPWAGSLSRGQALLRGEFSLAGRTITVQPDELDRANWRPGEAGPAWAAEMHGFDWLRDLAAISGDTARQRARQLVGLWINRYDRWDAQAWQIAPLGLRIAAWLGHYSFFCASADDAFRARFFDSLARQTRHLARVWSHAPEGIGRLHALKGLTYAAIALPDGARLWRDSAKLIDREVVRQILADGGHAARGPAHQLQALRLMIDIRAALRLGKIEVPPALQSALERAAMALRLYRHGDGGLALFNGSDEGDPAAVEASLALSKTRGRTPMALPDTGFQRLAAGRALLIVDTGAPSAIDGVTHAGTLSFEMSIGRERMIVNCGAGGADRPDWLAAMRATAAHSTLAVDDTNSSEIRGDGRLTRRARPLDLARNDADGAIWIECAHDGYLQPFGLTHRRRLYLSAGGDDLRGEDQLIGAGGKTYALRFHLHPKVQASLIQNGESVLLRLPSGQGWRLRNRGGQLALADDIYLGQAGDSRRTQQIVISGELAGAGASVKWALKREGKPA